MGRQASPEFVGIDVQAVLARLELHEVIDVLKDRLKQLNQMASAWTSMADVSTATARTPVPCQDRRQLRSRYPQRGQPRCCAAQDACNRE